MSLAGKTVASTGQAWGRKTLRQTSALRHSVRPEGTHRRGGQLDVRAAAIKLPEHDFLLHKPVLPKHPDTVSVPTQEPDLEPPFHGFNTWAEKVNGRAAMLGFISILIIEARTGTGIFELFGIQVGNGIDIGF